MNRSYLYHRKEVLALYRTCLYFAKDIGHIPGDTRKNTYMLRNYGKLSKNKRKKIIYSLKTEDLGAYVAWNIRKVFKDNKNLENKKKIDESIEYGYHFIRNMPRFLYPYSKDYLKDLWCYN